MKIKTTLFACIAVALAACSTPAREQVLATEAAFEQMVAEKGLSEAFRYFAADSAVILRENNRLIQGKEAIGQYYKVQELTPAKVTWHPETVEVSDCGTMASTYGHFRWEIRLPDETVQVREGVFHTVWKRQKDGAWRYIWD